MPSDAPAVQSLNVSYFFNLLYQLFVTGTLPHATTALSASSAVSFFSTIWFWISVGSYLFSLSCIGTLVYYSIRLHQTTEEVLEKFGTIPEAVAHQQVEHSRWKRIRELIESGQESDWRAAIIEADIMLDEMLSRLGYLGNSVGDKLKTASPDHFHTLQDAWEAHKVRNDIAHQGTAFQLSPNIAYRTIGHYENVFREFKEI